MVCNDASMFILHSPNPMFLCKQCTGVGALLGTSSFHVYILGTRMLCNGLIVYTRVDYLCIPIYVGAKVLCVTVCNFTYTLYQLWSMGEWWKPECRNVEQNALPWIGRLLPTIGTASEYWKVSFEVVEGLMWETLGLYIPHSGFISQKKSTNFTFLWWFTKVFLSFAQTGIIFKNTCHASLNHRPFCYQSFTDFDICTSQ